MEIVGFRDEFPFTWEVRLGVLLLYFLLFSSDFFWLPDFNIFSKIVFADKSSNLLTCWGRLLHSMKLWQKSIIEKCLAVFIVVTMMFKVSNQECWMMMFDYILVTDCWSGWVKAKRLGKVGYNSTGVDFLCASRVVWIKYDNFWYCPVRFILMEEFEYELLS